MTFRVGQEVVCIFDYSEFAGRWAAYPAVPFKGSIYRVREIDVASDSDGQVLRLEEILCAVHPDTNKECGWRASAFRPIVVTNIDVFTAMLAPSPQKQVERV